MPVLAIVLIWTLASIPASLVLGAALHHADVGFASDEVRGRRRHQPSVAGSPAAETV
jgi:hypothetical protein